MSSPEQVTSGIFLPKIVSTRNYEPGIDYLSSPVSVSAAKTEDGSTAFSATIEHPPLDGRQLLKFLKVSSPDTEDGSLYGVINDWNIVDRHLPYADKLVSIHEHIGEPWRLFMQSRPLFLNILNGVLHVSDFDKRNYSQVYRERTTGLWPEADAIERIYTGDAQRAIADQLKDLDKTVDLLTRYGIQDPESAVTRMVGLAVKRGKGNRKQYRNIAGHRDKLAEILPRVNITGDVVRAIGQEGRNELTSAYREQAYDMLDAANGTRYVYRKDTFNETGLSGLQEANVVRSIDKEGLVSIVFDNKGNQVNLVAPKSVHEVEFVLPRISPLITWRRDTEGNRVFDFSEPREITQNVHTDTILGALAVAYFTPELTQSWPKKMKIGDSYAQGMGAAQLPVLALFPKYQQQLLESSFIRTAEEAAEAA